ncbi:MAG: hypothetical protein H7831_15635 [Magnetococcus sp. WYHC-3]
MLFATADEARSRWCPFVRIRQPDAPQQAAYNWTRWDPQRGDMPRSEWADAACKGPMCMAWRWDVSGERERGYCGLAGTPR